MSPKSLALLLLALVHLALLRPATAAAGEPSLLQAADDARVAATIQIDRPALEAIFSDELHYAHSNGTVDDKAAYIDLLVSGRTQYLTFDYAERSFTFPAPGIALMSGKARIRARNGGSDSEVMLGFLAVWRNEQGRWRFLAWQSCRLPDTAPAAQ